MRIGIRSAVRKIVIVRVHNAVNMLYWFSLRVLPFPCHRQRLSQQIFWERQLDMTTVLGEYLIMYASKDLHQWMKALPGISGGPLLQEPHCLFHKETCYTLISFMSKIQRLFVLYQL